MSGRAAGALPRRWHGMFRGPVRAIACAVVLLESAVLPGCTTAEPSDPPASAAHAGVRSPTALSAPTGLPSDGVMRTTCGDDLGDGAGHDLAEVVLARDDGELVAGFTLAAPPVSGGTFLTVELRTADGTPLRRLGVELDRGEPVAAYVADSSTSVQRLDGAVHVEGAEVHAVYPVDVLDGLGSNWGWVASVGTDNEVDDVCPGSGTGAVSPIVVP
jgi:hypothetical protein